MTFRDIPVARIDPGVNVRTSETLDEDEELATSMEEVGVLQPIRVRPDGDGGYRLIVGYRRYAAAMLAGIAALPAIVDERPVDPTRDAIDQLTENIQRQDLNPMDVAVALQRIMATSPALSAAALARQLGKNKGWAHHHLGLLRLDPEVQTKIRAGKVTMAHAIPIVALPPVEQMRLARMAESGASSKAIEQAAYPSMSSISMHLGQTILTVRRDPESTRYGCVVVDSAEPFTTMHLDAVQLRRVAKVLGAIAAMIETDHPQVRQRERVKPTNYPATRRPAKRPRRPGVRGASAA